MGDACAARAEAETLQAEAIAAVNDRRIPDRYQEELLASVTALVESIDCVPPPPAGEHDDEDEDGEDEDEKKDDENDKKDEKKGEKGDKGEKKGEKGRDR